MKKDEERCTGCEEGVGHRSAGGSQGDGAPGRAVLGGRGISIHRPSKPNWQSLHNPL